MKLACLHLTHFRNHTDFKCKLPEGKLYISGPNGAGKTGIIESLYLLMTSRSFRSKNIMEIRQTGSEFLRVAASFTDHDTIKEAVIYHDSEKKFLVDGAAYDLTEFIYNFPVICYSPEYESYFSDNHRDRRAFIDRAIFYTDSGHMALVKKYNALLIRKRAELSKDNPDTELTDILNKQMAPVSQEISRRRNELVENINTLFSKDHLRDIFMPDMRLSFSTSTLYDRDAALEAAAGRPLYGCHKDLLYMKKNGKVMEKFQSFGQRKSALLFLLYHTAKYIENKRSVQALILLDDFEAGLDNRRKEALDGLFSYGFQTVITGLEEKKGCDNLTLGY